MDIFHENLIQAFPRKKFEAFQESFYTSTLFHLIETDTFPCTFYANLTVLASMKLQLLKKKESKIS